MRCGLRRWAPLLLLAVALPSEASAAVTKVTITARHEIADSSYEKLAGTVSFLIDPNDPNSRLIVGLDKAPRNAAGFIEFSSELFVLRPRDAAHSNGAVLIETASQGRRDALRWFDHGGPNPDPESSADMGDGFLMKFGFTVAWIGWEVNNRGLGFAALRDFAGWIKHGPDATISARHVYGFGAGQSGVFLHDFLGSGLNTDDHQQPVLDGALVHSAVVFPAAAAGGRGGAPKVFYTNTSADYWSSVGSRPADVAVPENVRVYLFAGTQDEPDRFPPTPIDGHLTENAVDYWWAMRALLLAMHRWVSAGTPPPASAYPTLADHTLVEARTRTGERVFVPAVDEDGNEKVGVRLPDVAVPLATYTGWSSNWFPATPAARTADNDSRRSVAERYASHDGYLATVREVAESLARRGYLLFDDVDRIVQRADDTWDLVTQPTR